MPNETPSLKVLALSLLLIVPLSADARDCKPIHPGRLYASGTEYSLDLGDVSGADEVRIEESTSSLFNKSKTLTYFPRTMTAPRFQHVSMRTQQVFYRVTLFNDTDPSFIPCTWKDLVTIQGDPAIRAAIRRSYVPVVGSGPGANGAQFKTSMTIINTNDEPTHGKLIFRTEGASGSASDPSIAFSLQPNERREFADVVAAFGRTGLGSVDIVLDDDAPDWLPIVQTRAFNETADGATFGTAVPQVPSVKLGEGEIATYLVPDPKTSRLNIGFRTWEYGGEADIILHRADGAEVAIRKEFPGDYFLQQPAADWIGHDLVQGDVIYVIPLGAIVYGTLTDNKSNDPTLLTRFGELAPPNTYVGEWFY